MDRIVGRSGRILAILLVIGVGGVPAEDMRAVIDWSSWDRLLRNHVVNGFVDYNGLRSDPAFSETVNAIAEADLSGAGESYRLAFLINAYNVLAIQGILDGRSPRTAIGKLNFFYRTKFTVAGERMSLNSLEHDLIRPLGEPRIHFAIVCASASCPPLRSEAYVPARLDTQLADNARVFLNDTTKNRFDVERGVAELSKIFKWFSEDFGGDQQAVQRSIAAWVEDSEVSQRLTFGGFKIRYLDYDWSLNGSLETH